MFTGTCTGSPTERSNVFEVENYFLFFPPATTRGKVVQNCLFGATTHKYIDFTALNAGIRYERKSQIRTNLEKNAPVIPTSPSNHVCTELEL